MFSRILNRLAALLNAPEPQGGGVTPPALPSPAVAVAPEAQKRGRPASPSLLRTMEALAVNPQISASELAAQLSVSSSYARTLLRRARMRTPAVVPAPPATVSKGVEQSVADLAERLELAERTIQQLRVVRPSSRASWDVSRRAEVIRRSLRGESAAKIAADLSAPSGEVAFILKIHRILMSNA